MSLSKSRMAERKRQERNVKPKQANVKPELVEIAGVNVTPEHPIMKYLIPGERRKKMESIVESVKNHKQLENVRFGYGNNSLSMDFVGELLDIT